MSKGYTVAPWFPRNPLLAKKDADDEAQRESKQCWALPKEKRGAYLDHLRQRYADMLTTELLNATKDDEPPRPLKRANADVGPLPTRADTVVSTSQRYLPTQDEVNKALRLQLELFAYGCNCTPAQLNIAYFAWHESQQHE